MEFGQLTSGPSRFPPSVDWLLQPCVTPALLRARGQQGRHSAQQLGKRPKGIVYTLSRPSPSMGHGTGGHCDHESICLLDFHLLLFIRAYPSQEITEQGELDGFSELLIVPKTSK